MERDGLGVIAILFVALILVAAIIIGCFIFMPPSLKWENQLDALKIGESMQISISSFGVPQLNDAFYFASDDPDIIAVDDNGVLTAFKEGTTQIYIQSRANHRQRLIIDLSAEK